jgi:hypothetical protein
MATVPRISSEWAKMDYQTLHKYQDLADQGKCRPLTCDDCGTYLAVRRGKKEDVPELQCFTCGTRMRPGLNMTSRIEAVVKEHHG